MSSERDRDASELLRQALRSEAGEPPTSGLGRMARTARAALRTGVGMLGGRFRGRGDGLEGVDLATVEKLVRSLGELKGIAMKAGQILGYIDPSLPPQTRQLLSLLQTESQPTPFDRIQETLREELGERAQRLLDRLLPDPVSVASIGQVHRATLPNGTDVAVKVLHPGIEKALKSDFRLAGVAPTFARLLAPGGVGSVRSFIREAETRLLEECDYQLEAQRQRRFYDLFADNPTVTVPAVQDAWSTRRVLTTRWEPGESFDDFLASDPSQSLRDRVGETLFRFYLGTLYRHALFHADPHPGNVSFRPEGNIVVYDYGCVREFDAGTMAALVSLSQSVRADRRETIEDALVALGANPPRRDADFDHVRGLLRSVFGPMLVTGAHPIDASISTQTGQILRDKRQLMRLSLPGKLLFLFRIRFGLYAVLARLGARCDWAALEAESVGGRAESVGGRS